MTDTLQQYNNFAPTGFDREGRYTSLGEERGEWFVAPVGQNRDSGIRQQSNFAVCERELEKLDPDGETWEVHRFGHWGPGWYEIILVAPESTAFNLCIEFASCLDNYPILDDSDLSEREYEAAASYWEGCRIQDRIGICDRFNVSIFAARRDEIPQDETGELLSYLAE